MSQSSKYISVKWNKSNEEQEKSAEYEKGEFWTILAKVQWRE